MDCNIQYGYPNKSLQIAFRKWVTLLLDIGKEPWLIIGDLNETVELNEKDSPRDDLNELVRIWINRNGFSGYKIYVV